ncbi:Na/Pi cotransporter family protein [bacterium]|nr:Na/Pi cotransporter family protein [bacterium]
MDIFSIFNLLGGLAFFLYGMNVMSSGLEKVAGGRLEKMLRQMTSNPYKGLLLGAGITIAIQSSSALTVMLVGLVNSGIMELGQTIGVIMGAHIGTTLTAWILSLSGIDASAGFFLKMLKPESFAPIFALVGVCMMMASQNNRRKSMGGIMVGFSILMFGMIMMSKSMSPLADMPNFQSILTAFTNPILGVLVGAVFTGIIQSSAAAVGILQALSLTGSISFGMAVPIIMGMNVGTCVTAMISSIGVNTNAKRVAFAHISCNILGVIICLPLFFAGNYILEHYILNTPVITNTITPVGIALSHTIFNIMTTIFLFPFIKQIEKLAITVVKPQTDKDEENVFLDERLLVSPSFAITECKAMTDTMAIMAKKNLFRSIKMINNYSPKRLDKILRKEPRIDTYEDKLGTFLVKLSSKDMSEKDSNEISKLLHSIGDFERIGDHAINILKVAQEMHEKEVHFSDEAKQELQLVVSALSEISELTIKAFCDNDTEAAKKVEPLEQVMDILTAEVKDRHIRRLQEGKCTIELGFMLSDVITNIERVSDHYSNVAACMIQIEDSALNTHDYLNEVKNSDSAEFKQEFEIYKEKYSFANLSAV